MSEKNNGGFDIFADGALNLGSQEMIDPFGAPEETAADPFAQAPTEAAPTSPESVPEAKKAAPETEAVTPKTEPKPKAKGSKKEDEPVSPLAAAVEKAEEKQTAITAESLFSKAPVFEYAGAAEDIADTTMTFEQLRVAKASDFPELEDGKRVSWTMEYCGIVKSVPTPTKTVIGALKQEIEQSKAFLDALKKSKDKNPVCKVKPKITAQSKGIAGYKGVFPSMEEAEQSDKLIRIVPARDGCVYEIRCTEVGKFADRTENVSELSEIRAGFTPALPPMPFPLFTEILSFFRHYMKTGQETEVMVHAYWDKKKQEYRISVPMQTVSKASISVVIPPEEALDAERYLHVADIHSHNSMPAFFSSTDDKDELATRVYMVVGRLTERTAQVSTRISVGGRFVPIDMRLVVDVPNVIVTSGTLDDTLHNIITAQDIEVPTLPAFPEEWMRMVTVAATPKKEWHGFQPESQQYGNPLLNSLAGLFLRQNRRQGGETK